MPFIQVKLDAKESKTAPEGRYPLRIIKVDQKKTGEKSKHPGETYYMLMLSNDQPDGNFSPVFTNLMFPNGEYDENVNNMRKLDIQRLLAQFNIAGSADGFDTDDLLGASAECMLTVGEDDKGNKRNEVRLDRLDSDEGDEEDKPSRRRGRRGNRSVDEEIPF